MRDDIREIILALKNHYLTKKLQLTSLSHKETELLYSLKSGNTDRADLLLDEDQDIIAKIDEIDAEIRNTIDAFSRITGIDAGGYERYLNDIDDEDVDAIHSLRKNIREQLGEIYGKRGEVNRLISAEMEKTGKDLNGLALMRKIRFSRED